MADLEDQIFKQNIPGRYSSWWNNDCNEKNKGMGRNGGDSDSDCESTSNDSQPIKSIDESSSNNLYKNSCHRGGVKGVLEDYKLHRNHESNLLKEDAWTERNKISSGTGLTCEERSCSLPSLREQHRQQLLLSMDQKNNHHQTDVSGESSEEEEEDEFLKRYQAKRLDQWKETAALAAQHSDNLPLAFGEIAEVDPVRFAEIIDEEEESNVPVVIHMYENCIPACVAFNSHLESLARSMVSDAGGRLSSGNLLRTLTNFLAFVYYTHFLLKHIDIRQILTPTGIYSPSRV